MFAFELINSSFELIFVKRESIQLLFFASFNKFSNSVLSSLKLFENKSIFSKFELIFVILCHFIKRIFLFIKFKNIQNIHTKNIQIIYINNNVNA